MKTDWSDLLAPHVRKFEVAAAIDGSVTYNAVGCKNMALLLKEIGKLLDREVGRRK